MDALLPRLWTSVKRPIRWLQTISRYKVTHSQGPNFAYEHCIRKITPEQSSSLDLSNWRTASNGAEPIRKETLERFVQAFEPFGFRWSAFYPAYGLAEATLLVSTKRKTDMPVFCAVSAAALSQNQIVEAYEHQQGVQILVGCGHPVGNMRVVIAHPETLIQCAPNEVGEIWVSDSSVALGYWNRPEETERTFRAYLANTDVSVAGRSSGPFLRTGDLGFLKDGELFVTGRLKDLIIIRGRNHYPQDIELTVEQSHLAMRPSCGAAFSVDVTGDERLVIVQEVERHYRNLDVDEVVAAIRHAVAEHHDLEIYAVLLLKTGSIPKTSSGKLQHQACRTSFLDGSLEVVGSWTSNNVAELKQETVPVPPIPGIISKERADDLIDWLRTYANERINSRLIDERRCIPPYVVLDFGNRGILGMQVPEQYGGIALRNRDAMRVVEQLAAIDLTLATFVCINNFLGIRPIQRYATQAIRDELLPILAKGRELAAFALTEPGAGSNPRAICATAVADAIGGWRLSGNKIWSGSASWAGLINVFVQLVDANNKSSGITGFVVRQGTTGLRVGSESLTMGMRGVVQNFVHLDEVPVDSGNLLGEPGAGMEAAQDAMLFTRLAIGAMSIGGMKRCTQLMIRYATRRDIATGLLIDNPVTLARLSDLTAAIAALETLVTRIAELLDDGCFVPVEAYVACKTSGPELLWKAADSLIQLLGGRGYIETNIAPQILRDARVFRIFEGPTETLNMFLGSRVLSRSSELHQFLCDGLGAPAVSDSLRKAAEQINALVASTSPFSDRPSALRWASMLIGEVATDAILLAAVQGAVNRTPSDQLRRAVEWARSQFEQTLARVRSSTPRESVLLNANETTDLISSYAETIGDLEQTLAGEDDALDGLLRRLSSRGLVEQEEQRESVHTDILSEQSPPPLFCSHAASIETWIAKWIADKLKIAVDSIDTRKSLVYYGLDSVTAIGLSSDLEVWLGRQLSSTLAWDYPSIETLAQHLAEEIYVAVGKNISMTNILQAPTVEQLANIFRQEESEAPWSVLVPIQTGGDKQPFFGVHDAARGDVIAYYNLARYLGSEQPVYGLQAQGLDGKQVPHSRVEDMAAHYIKEILTIQPEGPYFLGGYSLGGVVAFEMAQQFHAQGQKVAMLALFDTQGPGWFKPLPFHTKVSRHLSNFLQLELKEKLTYVKERLTGKFYSDNKRKSPLLMALDEAARDYVPQVYSGRAILFRASEQPPVEWGRTDPQLGWGSLVAGGLEIHEVPGNHGSILSEPYVRVIAEKLQACLDRRSLDFADS